jgi:hypothetical protein
MKLPKELDIPQIAHPSAAEMMTPAVRELMNSGKAEQKSANDDTALAKALISIAGQAWRLGTAVKDSETNEVKTVLSQQEIRKVANIMETINQVIIDLGIKIIDRCNQDFHPGLPDQVVTEEPKAGISKEQIIRTIRPTIMWHQTMVQRGEIDIAVPVSKN